MRRSLHLLSDLAIGKIQPPISHNRRQVCLSSVLQATKKSTSSSKSGQSGTLGGGSRQREVGSRFGQANSSSSGNRSSAQRSTTRSRMSTLEVKHDKGSKCFVLNLGNNGSARIDYKSLGGDKIEMYHTEVPANMRGKGIGRVLAEGALDTAAKANMKVRLTCSYLIHYINKYATARQKQLVEK